MSGTTTLAAEGGTGLALDGSSALLAPDAGPTALPLVPLPPVYAAADFLAQFQALLPRGLVWPRDPDAVQTQALSGLMPTYARQCQRAAGLVVDAFPASAEELLPEWESTLGLPDPCAGESPTVAQRRAQVVARLTGRGGQSAAYFISYAAALGYTIEIEEYAPFRAGSGRAGQAARGVAWAHAWTVLAPQTTVTLFRAGASSAGEPLAAWGNAVLECELKAIKPAHTTLTFSYGADTSSLPPGVVLITSSGAELVTDTGAALIL